MLLLMLNGVSVLILGLGFKMSEQRICYLCQKPKALMQVDWLGDICWWCNNK
jgi:hypothetical protein